MRNTLVFHVQKYRSKNFNAKIFQLRLLTFFDITNIYGNIQLSSLI